MTAVTPLADMDHEIADECKWKLRARALHLGLFANACHHSDGFAYLCCLSMVNIF